jgi:serine/threonine-protein kinase
MAPELFTGAQIDKQVDVHALGCLLYEAVTGQPPFTGDAAVLMYKHINDEPPLPSLTAPDMGTHLDAVIHKALAKDPTERYATAGELAEAAHLSLRTASPASWTSTRPGDTARTDLITAELQSASASPQPTLVDHGPPSAGAEASPPESTPTAGTASPRSRLLAIAGVGIIATLILIGGVWTWHTTRSPSDQPLPTTPGASSAVASNDERGAATASKAEPAMPAERSSARFTPTSPRQDPP